MSDFSTSSFQPESSFQAPSEFDVGAVERNVKTISAVEERWRLPALPDSVKLDLATMPETSPRSLSDFLLGLDDDLNDREEPEPPEVPPQPFEEPRTAGDEFRIFTAGLTGQLHPTDVTPDAVKKFKVDAVRAGLLEMPSDGKFDSNWSPELNRLRRDMVYDDLDKFYSGDRPGAASTSTVLDKIGDWTQPSGLLAAATQLDLFWDFNAMGDEWSSWGDKWRKVGKSTNPLDFGKNLLDAVTGPIDDLVFPAMNIVLLGTGLGAMANAGRIGWMGTRALESGKALRTLYSGTRAFVPSLEPGWLAGRLAARTSPGALKSLGDAMVAWRNIEGVQQVKKGVQIGMRAGFLSQVEDLVPGYQGGVDLTSLDPVEHARQSLRNFGLNSYLATPLELAIAPQNIFTPGTFVQHGGQGMGVLSSAARGFIAAGGTIPGRAAVGGVVGAGVGAIMGDDGMDVASGATFGALGTALLPVLAKNKTMFGAVVGSGIGAGVAVLTGEDAYAGAAIGAVTIGAATGISMLPDTSAWWQKIPNPGKWVGHASDVVARLDYSPFTQDQRLGLAIQNGIRKVLANRPEDLARFETAIADNPNSFRHALAEYLYGKASNADLLASNLASTDAAVTYITVAAAIDYTALAQAKGRMSDQYHLFRNKLISQLRTFDLDSQFLPEDLAQAIAIDRTFGADHERIYRKVLDQIKRHPESARELAEQHNQLARQTLEQLTSLENLPDLDDLVRMEPWRQVDAAERIGIVEAYLEGGALDTFGNWPQFSAQSLTVENWVNSGMLDDATFRDVLTPWMRNGVPITRQPKANIHKVKDTIIEADEAIVDTIVRNPTVRQKVGGRMAVTARVQPSGRVTVARADTIVKQDLEAAGYKIQDLIEAAEKLKDLTAKGVMKKLRDSLGDATLASMDHAQVKAFLAANGFGKNDKQINYIHDFMLRHGVSDADLAKAIDDAVNDLVADSAYWAGLRISPIARNADGVALSGIDALKSQRQAILHRARYTAAEIDTDALVASLRANQGDQVADEFLLELEAMRRDNYKLVHGVEYLMPHDLVTKTDLFRDFGVRELNAATLGNFFSRRQPAVARMAQERRERLAIVNALTSHGLGDFDPDSTEITQVYHDLRSILLEIQDPIARMTEERHLLGMWEKFRHAQESAFAPLRVDDLARKADFVKDRLVKMGWTDEQAKAIFASIRNFRNTEFKDLGLYALEAKVRSANLNVSALKWLSSSGFAEGVMSPTRLGAAVGAYAGQDFTVGQLDEDASGVEVRGAQVAGILGGALLGGVGGKAVAKVGQAATAGGAILRAEQRAGWMLGDRLARFRDAMRFSLSPIFDLSRYTEGAVLSKIGTPLRNADGARVLLPANLSPTAVKKRYGKEAFDQARNEFSRISKGMGHGDVDVLDDAGHYFTQIGILGFNPHEWQVGAFTELVRAGFTPDDAYAAARATHTYGTRGRSAAELSTNFIFFPFSYQKKMMTHAAKWLQDDLGRSILLHDAFKTYEELDAKYDLDQWWKDHIPALEQLQRMNVFAYGVSPGRFGGINSQLFETTGKAILMFSPIAVNLEGEEDYAELKRLTRSLMPAYNDINWMIEEVKDSRYLVEGGQLRRGQIRQGYDEWNEYRREVYQFLEDNDFSWYDLHNKPYLIDQKLTYEAKLAEVQRKYPAWTESRRESIFNAQALEMERNDLLRAAQADPEHATQEAFLLDEFEGFLTETKQQLRRMLGVSVDGTDGWLDAPPWASDAVMERAAQMANANPRFIGVWRKFYEKELGPIEAKL